VILYNLGLGAKKNDLKWVFEGASDFEVLPTFGVVPQFQAQSGFPLAELLPNFSPVYRPCGFCANNR
jgi:multifunctional beta-oxidation protein